MPEALFDVETIESLHGRVMAAIFATSVNRFEVEFEWPECHAKRCQHRHGDPRQAMAIIQHQIAETVKLELRYRATTRPDVSDPDDSPADAAVWTLAALLNRYNVHDAGTFVKAARLIVDAYPGLVAGLTAMDHTNRSQTTTEGA